MLISEAFLTGLRFRYSILIRFKDDFQYKVNSLLITGAGVLFTFFDGNNISGFNITGVSYKVKMRSVKDRNLIIFISFFIFFS